MAKLDFPSSPTDGQIYAGSNGVTYTWNDTVGVWTAAIVKPLEITNAGSISGTPVVGETLTYSIGRSTGGIPPYSYSWLWKLGSDGSDLQADGSRFVIPAEAANDVVYVELTVYDSVGEIASANTSVYPDDGSVIEYVPFPNLSFSPISSPNASPASVSVSNESLYGTVTATWADGPTTVLMTGSAQFSVNGDAYSSSSRSVVNGDTISVIWDPAAIAAAADGETLEGILTNGVNKNSFSITVDRAPANLSFSDLVDQVINTQIVSDTVTPSGYNVPVPFAFSGGSTPLTSLGVSVDGGAYSSSPQTVNPGQSVRMEGTTGSSNSTTYSVDITMGSSPTATSTWSVTTASVTPSIAQPSITSPSNGSTDINPALNDPAGITLIGSTYTPINGAGAHASSDWELYEGGYPLTSTNTITSVTNTDTPLTSVTDLVGAATGVTYDTSRSRFYAVGPVGNSWISTDGLTWSSIPSDNTVSLYEAASNNSGMLVAISRAANNLIYYSLDGGATWTPGSFDILPGNKMSIVLWTGSRFVAAATGGSNTWTSTDGITFTRSASNPWGTGSGKSLQSLVWDPNTSRLIATRATSGTTPRLGWSSDFGATWTTSGNLNSWGAPRSSVAGSYVFFTAVDDSRVGYSTDGGTTVTTISSQFSSKPHFFWEENGTYYAALNNDSVVESSDPTDWTGATTVAGASVDVARLFTIAQSPAAVAISTRDSNANAVGFSSSATLTTLTIADCLSDGFRENDTVISNPVGGGPATIISVDNTQVQVTSSTGWLGNSTQNLVRDSNSYSLVDSSTGDTTNLVSWPVAQSFFAPDTNYYTRVRYTSTDPVSSSWSAWSEFATAFSFALDPGVAIYGGYFGGQINDGGIIYNLIVAPITEGSLDGQYGGSSPIGIQYKTSTQSDGSTVQNQAWGAPATTNWADPKHPMFDWAVNSGRGPNAGAYDASNTTGTGIGGYNDWYIPAEYELEILYRNLKPTAESNDTQYGANPNAVPSATSNYTTKFPTETTSTLFISGQSQAFSRNESYWSATGDIFSGSTAIPQSFLDGDQQDTFKPSERYARAIRRVAA